KRPLMGRALNAGADIPIFTSDNPRSEDPQAIIEQMLAGVELQRSAEIILERRSALQRAIDLAEKGDVVVVLGRGHESGQEINGVKVPFNDVEELDRALRERA
ncbi:MAG: glutamate ligase domain-containing protein, partial [Candidatus Nanopelagicaceae bacterium]